MIGIVGGRLSMMISLACGMFVANSQIGQAQAVAEPPARNANIWDGRAHEPNPGAVTSEERKAGIAPDAQRQQKLDQEVEHLDRKLEKQASPQ